MDRLLVNEPLHYKVLGYSVAMGAVLGIAAYGRTKEKDLATN
jgi:hypothetical protein